MEIQEKYKSKLNEGQFKAVTTTEGPVLIIAGAGAGKTHALINRVSYLIECGVTPESILLLTFTNAAANEMKSRAASMLDERCEKITACTYHSFCAAILRKYGKNIGIPAGFSIMTPSDVNDGIGFVRAKNDKYKMKGFPKNAVIAGIFSAHINKGIPIFSVLEMEKYRSYRIFKNEIEDLFEEFQVYKKSKDLLDYDDLLIEFYKLLNIEWINKQISDTYKYIMVDEFQDTNNLQEKIILALRKTNNNIAVVGDDYQSIYAFRGSNVDNFINFPNKLPGCKKVVLDMNYRSTQEILDLANNVMHVHANFGFKKNMKANNKSGNKPFVWSEGNSIEEAYWIVKQIKEMHKDGKAYKDIAILERNSSNSFMIEQLLTEAGIPYDKKGGLKLMEHACVLDIIAYLKCLVNAHDDLAWWRILQLHPGIGDTYARNIAQSSIINDDFLIYNNYKKRKFYPELVLLDTEYKKLHEMNLEDNSLEKQYDEICEFYFSLRERVANEMDTTEDKRGEYLDEIKADKETLALVKTLIIQHKTASGFLDAITLDATPDVTQDANADKLTISTIHSAKGLEWDTVFILDCLEGDFPKNINPTQYGSPEDNEELRCFYVAITRAKTNLTIMCPTELIKYGKYMEGVPSHYLDESKDYYDSLDAPQR